MNDYYDITARLAYYGRLPEFIEAKPLDLRVVGKLGREIADVTRWKDPPHEALANVRRSGEWNFCDPKAVEVFVKRYGVLHARISEATSDFDESCVNFSATQGTLCRAWKGDPEALADIEVQVLDALEARTSVGKRGLELLTENLWSFICVLFLRDYAERRAKICSSPDCSNPYFLEKRKGQKYCSHLCAVRENVRRFRRSSEVVQTKQPKVSRKRGRRSVNGAHKAR